MCGLAIRSLKSGAIIPGPKTFFLVAVHQEVTKFIFALQSDLTYCLQTMSRSAIDATRFTATSPHAYSKPFAIRSSSASATSTSSSSSHPLPPSFLSPLSKKNALPLQKPSHNSTSPSPQKFAETPAQKVARLRAARYAAKYAEAPLWDRIVIRGRYVADKAHRITVYSLMGLTGKSSFRLHFPPPPSSLILFLLLIDLTLFTPPSQSYPPWWPLTPLPTWLYTTGGNVKRTMLNKQPAAPPPSLPRLRTRKQDWI